MKIAVLVLVCGMLTWGAAAGNACTDPTPRKSVQSAGESSIVFEYFRPAKLQEKKKAARTLAQIADSVLTSARAEYEGTANTAVTGTDSRVAYEIKSAPQEYRERAEIELYRIKSWADSICNSFRRGTYKIGPEDAPR